MFSQTSEYALRAVVFLAEHQPHRFPVTRIAEATRTPTGYLAKVLQNLARVGVVTGQRGLRGGFTLSRSPESISVLEVLNAVDPLHRIQKCPLDNPDHAHKLCRLHQKLDDALETVETGFREATLADLMTENTFGPVGGGRRRRSGTGS